MINTHKYKAKILPGTLKRGRAKKLIQDIFSKIGKIFHIHNVNSKLIARGNDVETTLIKGVPEDQIMEIIPKGSQVLAAGLNKIKQTNKKNKKNKS